MPVTVVVGGQFGSEGKGKVAHWLANELGASAAVRVGGPNSGHTVIASDGQALIFKQLPTAALLPDVVCVLPAGSYITPSILLAEMSVAGLGPERLVIDPNAVVITSKEVHNEETSDLRSSIGSTLSGTGAAVIARAKRDGSARLARDEQLLSNFIRPAAQYLRDRLAKNERVIIEGTQGFGLSVLHSPHYPYATSRDTSAAGFVSEAGISPLDVDDVTLVIRAFPIRVAGHSGPLANETTWDNVTQQSGSRVPLLERTSVTKAVRRVGAFDPFVVSHAIVHNRPTRIVLNHLDYIDVDSSETLPTTRVRQFIVAVEASVGARMTHWGFGPASIAAARAS